MHESDVILLAAFDDEPQPLPHPALAEARPTDRPRPDPATHPRTDRVSLVLLESDAEPTLTSSQFVASIPPISV